MQMLYLVEIEGARGDLAKVMSGLREWLNLQRFEPDAFRCVTDAKSVIFRLEFGNEAEAVACAESFRGKMTRLGDRSAA